MQKAEIPRSWTIVTYAAISVCMTIGMVELLSAARLSTSEYALAIAYLLSLFALYPCPRLFCHVLIMLGLAESLIPVTVNGPTVLWGVWLSLILLSAHISPLRSGILATALMSSCYVMPILQQQPITIGLINMSATYPAASLIGYAFWMQRRLTAADTARAVANERMQQQERQLDLVHHLHDSIAGSLTYEILLCRMYRNDGFNQTPSDFCNSIEELTSQILNELRADIIHPMLRAERLVQNDIPSTRSSPAYCRYNASELHALADRQANRLKTLGFIGDIYLRYDFYDCLYLIGPCAGIIQELVNNIMKHSSGRSYFINVFRDGATIHIVSSNDYRSRDAAEPDASREDALGCTSIRRTVESLSGTMTTNYDNQEWVISIVIPMPNERVTAVRTTTTDKKDME